MDETSSRLSWSAAERESFFEAQRRNRLATWQLTALSYCVAATLAFAVSALFAPLLWGVFVVLTDLLSLVFPIVDFGAMAWRWFEELTAEPMTLTAAQVVGGIAAGAAPGLVISLAFWFFLRRLAAEASVAVARTALQSRALDPVDLEEQQLRNTVNEMAISANIRVPDVWVYPSGRFINGLSVGSGTSDGAVIVSRGALEQLNRAQTQALVGHLVGSISNGDLHVAGLVLTVRHLAGLLRLLSIAAFEPHARHLLVALVGHTRDLDATIDSRAELISELAAAATMNENQPQASVDKARPNRQMTWRDAIKIPVAPAMLTGGVMLPMLTGFVLLPLFAFSWRSRRMLADATAVQLTRDVDSLSQCLEKIAATGISAPGSIWLNSSFFTANQGMAVVGSHPPLSKRVVALRRMGAHVEKPPHDLADFALKLLVGAALCACFALGGVAVVLMSFVSVALSMFTVLPIVGVLHMLLR